MTAWRLIIADSFDDMATGEDLNGHAPAKCTPKTVWQAPGGHFEGDGAGALTPGGNNRAGISTLIKPGMPIKVKVKHRPNGTANAACHIGLFGELGGPYGYGVYFVTNPYGSQIAERTPDGNINSVVVDNSIKLNINTNAEYEVEYSDLTFRVYKDGAELTSLRLDAYAPPASLAGNDMAMLFSHPSGPTWDDFAVYGAETADLILNGQAFHKTWEEDWTMLDAVDWEPYPGARWYASPFSVFSDAGIAGPDVPSAGRPMTTVVEDGRQCCRIEIFNDGQGGVGGKGWHGGLLQTKCPKENGGFGGFEQNGGYFECELKVPAEPGAWSSFWLMSKHGRAVTGASPSAINESGEIDIMEYWGVSPTVFQCNMHRWGGNGIADLHVSPGNITLPDSRRMDQWNRFGCWIDYADLKVKIYVNRQKVAEKPIDDGATLKWYRNRSWFPIIQLLVDLSKGTPPNPSYAYYGPVSVYKERIA